jgi:hypothetical protein
LSQEASKKHILRLKNLPLDIDEPSLLEALTSLKINPSEIRMMEGDNEEKGTKKASLAFSDHSTYAEACANFDRAGSKLPSG